MAKLARLLGYARPYQGLFAAGVLISSCAMLAQLSFPWILRFLIDDVIANKRPELLGWAVSMMVGAALVTVVMRALEQYVFTNLGGRALIDIRRQMARHLMRLPLARLQSERSGQVMSLFTSDAPALARLYEAIMGQTVVSALRFIISVLIIALIYRRLIFVILIAIPIYMLVPMTIGKLTRMAGKAVQEKNAGISADLQESISAARETKAFNRQRWAEDRLRESFTSLLRPQLRVNLLQSSSFATYLAFWTVAGIIYWVGGSRVIGGEMTLGLLIASVGYFTQLEEPVSRFVNLNGQLQLVLAAGDRILEFLNAPAEPADRVGAVPIAACAGRVEFEKVCFAYQGGDRVLSEISFTASPGQKIALVGPSGGGKTTLVSLIPRFFEPLSGRILIDGRDVRDFTLESLRNCIGVVFQDSFLFAGSVRENIRFGGAGPSEEEVIAAAKAANAHEFIIQLAGMYETPVGERGVKLSGGQKQRLAIARALLRNPRILLLDEATSALDSESELAVQEALDRLMAGRTTFVIAHRLSTVVGADLIVVLDKGRIAGMGSHHQLMAECEIYRKLYSLQFSSQKNGDRSPAQPYEAIEPIHAI